MLVSGLAFFQWHLQRLLDGFCHTVSVIRVHQPPLQNETAPAHRGLPGPAQRRDHCHAGSAVQARQAFARHVAVHVANRHPVQFAKVTVGGTAQAFQLLQQIAIGVKFRAIMYPVAAGRSFGREPYCKLS